VAVMTLFAVMACRFAASAMQQMKRKTFWEHHETVYAKSPIKLLGPAAERPLRYGEIALEGKEDFENLAVKSRN